MADDKPSAADVANAAELGNASARRPFNPDGGEDEGGALDGGDDSAVHDDQKPITGTSAGAEETGGDDRHKTENLTKAGHDIDPDEGSD